MAAVRLASILLLHGDRSRGQPLTHALEAAGYGVTVACSSAEARKAMQTSAPDAIIIDAKGSQAVVTTFFELLQATPDAHATPILVLAHADLRLDTLPLSVTMVPGPVEAGDLVTAVRRCLDQPPTPRSCPLAAGHDVKSCLLYQRTERSKRLASETVRIQEDERRKLSLELHDDIAQILGNLILVIDASLAIAPLEDRRLQKYLSDARNTAKEGFRRVQRFSIELRPPILDDLGLAPTIIWYAERFTRETSIPVEVVLPDRLPPLDGEQQTALFRITQEALHNVRKHASARQVTVTVELAQGGLRLIVADDGVGFTPDEVDQKMAEGTHLGLAGMRYRASLIDGTFDIVSAGGKGTSIVVWMPLAKRDG